MIKYQPVIMHGCAVCKGNYVLFPFHMASGEVEHFYCEVVDEDEEGFWISVSENSDVHLLNDGYYTVLIQH